MRFNGLDPREISPKIFPAREIIQAIPPRSVRALETANGPLYVASELQQRTIQVEINVAGSSHENANELVRELNRVFVTQEPGEFEPTHTPGMALTAILERAGEMSWQWGFGTVTYEFAAMRPFFHATSETIINFTGARQIEPRGSVQIRPVIRHTMAAAAATLTYSLNGVGFFVLRPLSGSFAAGAVLTVDFANRLVAYNGEAAMVLADYTASTWTPGFISGSLITVSDAGPTEIRWRDEWM